MLIGIGIDLVELERIKEILSDKFIERILSKSELDEYQNLVNDSVKLEFVGGRFAAKEAIFKAISKGPGDTYYRDFSILHEESGKPYVKTDFFKNNENITVSITHTDNYAAAMVIIEEGK